MKVCSQDMGVRLERRVSMGSSLLLEERGGSSECLSLHLPEGWESTKEGDECHKGDEQHNRCDRRKGNHDCS